MSELLLALEIIGTISFAVSGALVAIRSKLDIFGVIVVACTTAVGGGIIRDLLLGTTPPLIFSRFYIVLIALITAVIVFVTSYVKRKSFSTMSTRIEAINNVFDAVGLAAFTVMGTELAYVHQSAAGNAFLILTLGTMTAVGGGVIRDLLTSNTPYVFKKHIYAIASILGSALYYGVRLLSTTSILLPTLAGIILVIALRLLATKFQWDLPKIKDLD